MSSAIILSDFLRSEAEEVDAPEKSIIYPWKDAPDHRFTEDVIILDTQMSEESHNDRSTLVADEETYRTMSILSESLDNLMESGRVVIGLVTRPTELYATENRTVLFHNFHWLPSEMGDVCMPPITGEYNNDEIEDHFIYPTPDDLDSNPVRNVLREQPFNTYFTNVEGTWSFIDIENSSVDNHELIATALHPELDVIAGCAIHDWDNEHNDFEHDGTLVLLPRPDEYWFDVEDWFRSLLEIGYHYRSQSEDFDQFNRLLGRTTYKPLKGVYEICHKFPNCVSTLSDRRGDKEPLEIEDEYDVQYLLNALLRTQFDDVRPEEYGPSHGGPAPRIDFLIKDETIAIEAKITREGRSNSDLRTELAEDKEQYRGHPDCEYLVCYIYDPIYEVKNPAGFESDLSEETDNLKTEVIVSSTPRYTTP